MFASSSSSSLLACLSSVSIKLQGSIFSAWLLPLLYQAQGLPGGVVSVRWSYLLSRDRDERNELVGAARDGFLAFCFCRVSSWLSRVGI